MQSQNQYYPRQTPGKINKSAILESPDVALQKELFSSHAPPRPANFRTRGSAAGPSAVQIKLAPHPRPRGHAASCTTRQSQPTNI